MSRLAESVRRLKVRAIGICSQRDWRGDCYEVALRLVTEGACRGVRLVHGWPTGVGGNAAGRAYGHAWVECGPWVFDLTVSSIPFDREFFYLRGKIGRVRSYSRALALRRVTLHQHYGPWEPMPRQVARREAVAP